ncbi:MAG: OpgC family protein [Geminicoccaceae bacterium]
MREARLDFFRGIAMFIIFIAHQPLNPWNNWIPARFGPSDATEMFVFCSGFASAIAFGGSFRRHGFATGSLRIAHRCWQVYWSHLGLFLAVAATAILGSRLSGGIDYVEALYLQHFFAEPRQGIVGLVTLTYVPNYFDILPMYIVVLAMVPVVMALARIGPAVAFGAVLTLYVAQWQFAWDLPAEWWSDRPWFFDPFGWQLIFFTGFAFGSGWLPEPPRDRRLFWAALLFVVAMVPLNWQPLWSRWEWLDQFSLQFVPFKDKTHFGILRFLHFLALAYVALWIVNPRRDRLADRWASPIILVGQQALPVFLWSMALAFVIGMVLDGIGRTWLTVAVANLGGFVTLVGVAALARYVRAQPWRQKEGRIRHAPGAAPALLATGS